jgi:hypothetical protein
MDKRIKNITATAERLKTPTPITIHRPLELVNPEETYLYNMTNYQDYAEFSRMFRYMNEPQTPLNPVALPPLHKTPVCITIRDKTIAGLVDIITENPYSESCEYNIDLKC